MRRIALIVGGVATALTVLAGGYWLEWFLGARSVQATFDDWVTERRASGYEVVVGSTKVRGFPGSVILDINGLEVGKPSDSLAWRWVPGLVRVASGAGESKDLTVRLLGVQSLAYRIGGETRTAQFTGSRFRLRFRHGETGALDRIAIGLSGFALQRPGDGPPIIARHVQIQTTLGDGDKVIPTDTEIVLRVEGLVLPEHQRGPLGNTIDFLQAAAVLQTGLFSLDLPLALQEWQKNNGHLIVSESRLRWASLNARANGVLQLDELLRPAGYLNAHIADFVPALEAFWAARRFDEHSRSTSLF